MTMKALLTSKLLSCLALLTTFSTFGADSQVLWQIGKPDQNNAEFALAPGGYAQFKDDAFYVIGQSDAKRDWPYVQPGPMDSWAGSRPHTFSIVFGVHRPGTAGTCKLKFDLIDTQKASPPKLHIEINGQPFDKRLPAGAGDASVEPCSPAIS